MSRVVEVHYVAEPKPRLEVVEEVTGYDLVPGVVAVPLLIKVSTVTTDPDEIFDFFRRNL